MFGLVIDEHGRAWPEGSKSTAAMAHKAGNFDNTPEGVLQSGSIYLRPLPRTLIVVFSPHLVARRTVTAAFFEIARRNPSRVDLLCYGAGKNWRETLSPVGEVFERIDQIVSEAVQSCPRGLVAARLRPEVIDRIAGGRLTPLFDAWVQTRGEWAPELYGHMRDQHLLERAVVVRNPRRSARLVIEHWGKKRDLFGADWVRSARGKDVEDEPYPGLASRAAAGMRETIAAHEPRLETVHMQVRTPTGRTRRRHYDRLLLPWTTAIGDAFVTTVHIFRKPG